MDSWQYGRPYLSFAPSTLEGAPSSRSFSSLLILHVVEGDQTLDFNSTDTHF